MASDQEASSSNPLKYSNSTRKTCKYDIFLSFRGEDTRKGFTGHLYHALNRSGFRVFRDDEELERGEVISTELKQAIEDSLFAIVVLSKNYASSSWCLNELQHILHSRDNLCQQVFPIFYDVDPSDVRHQRGSFAETFAMHQMLQRDNQVIKIWRDSLTNVAGLSGWDCKHRPEAELIDMMIEELWTKLRPRLPPYNEGLIGIDSKVEQLEPLLEMGLNDVRFVGIWGLPGVGKTTIARAVFEKYSSQFDISCFLHNVRETSERDGYVHLQNRLLSHLRNMEIEDIYEGKKIIQNRLSDKKVLLILDDVSHTSHLENMANSPNWFGAGSRVIITTRNSDLLRRGHEVYVHEVEIMSQDESLQLFCSKAFERSEPQEDLLELSKIVCDYAKGLPLALSVLGSYFCGRSNVSEWEDTLDMLKKDPHQDVFRILQISFEALTNIEKTTFLDIACFFNGWRKKEIKQILESCGFNAQILTTLHGKSLLKDYDGSLVMHDLLAQMARKIVVDESPNDVGNRSRLWCNEDIDEVMGNNLGTKEIQGMASSISCEACWHPEAFSTLRNLILLIVTSDFNLRDGLKCLSHALKVLHWTKYPLDTLPSGTQLYKLVDLRMRHSKLKKLWHKSMCSKNLKFLDLSYSKNLIETPDFSELPNMERLDLEGCEDLVDLHASIGQHKNLQVLNLKGCKNLKARCPKKLEMSALKEFVLFGCIQVKCLPEFGVSMKNLETFDVGETNIVKLPESLGLLTGLETLNLRGCKNLICLPESIHNLKRLKAIDVCGCLKFGRLPEKLNEMEALEEIDASETNITEVPSSIGGLKKVRKLSFRGCQNLICLPESIHNLKHLKAIDVCGCLKFGRLPEKLNEMEALEEIDASETNITEVPSSIGGLKKLRKLSFRGRKSSASNSWSLIIPLKHALFWGHSAHEGLALPASIWSIKSLTELDLSYCNIDDGSIPLEMGGLSSLEELDLSGNLFKNLPTGCLTNLLKLEVLRLNSCSELRSLPQSAPHLTTVDAGACSSLETVADGQLFHLFSSIDQPKWSWKGEVLGVTIPGSEIPSWFENQRDLCLDDKGRASIMIDMPPFGEEMLGFGLCVVLDDDMFYSTAPNKGHFASPCWSYDFTTMPRPHGNDHEPVFSERLRVQEKEIKSSHLWIVFWKQSEELSHVLQLSKHSQIPLTFSAHENDRTFSDAKVSLKCGWRVISKAL